MFVYETQGVCSTKIEFEIENNIIKSVHFTGGCNGNLSGISKLVVGMNIDDVIEKLQGTTCNSKSTSCPDQLTKALLSYKNSISE